MMGLAAFDAPHLLILDEPTNHLDIDSREALVHALNDYPGAVILISHDRHLIEACADRLWLVADGTVKPFDGDIEDYRRMVLGKAGRRRRRRRREAATAAATAEGRAPRGGAAPRGARAAPEEDQGLRARASRRCAGRSPTSTGSSPSPDLYADDRPRRDAGEEPRERIHAFARAESDWLDLSEQLEAEEAGEKVA